MGVLAPGQLKSRRGWHSSPRRLHYRFSFFDRVSRTHCGKNSINFAGMAHSHRHRLAAAWPSLVRQIGPVLRRRRHCLLVLALTKASQAWQRLNAWNPARRILLVLFGCGSYILVGLMQIMLGEALYRVYAGCGSSV